MLYNSAAVFENDNKNRAEHEVQRGADGGEESGDKRDRDLYTF